MTDVTKELEATTREVRVRSGEAGELRSAVLTRVYPTGQDDLWDACTNPERLPRWFLPVSGELRAGGRFQLQGNAAGTIERCDPPASFRATWEAGGAVGRIELRLTPAGEGATRLELEHISRADDDTWTRFGPGAVGLGWELGLIGLGQHIAGQAQLDPAAAQAWAVSPDGQRFITASSQRWGAAAAGAGFDASTAEQWVARTTAFYTGAPAPDEE